MLHLSRRGVFAFIGLAITLSLAANAGRRMRRGPFPITRSHIDKMTFTFKRKLEAPTQALALATHGILTDGLLTLDDAVTIQAIDPVTKLPPIGADGLPVPPVVYPAGTVLDPRTNPADDILIPKGITVSSTALADGDYEIGRFAYLGVVPRFESKNLEMFASKMGHTLRVKAYVTQDVLDTYEFTLLDRFKSFSDMFAKPTIHLEPLKDLRQMADAASNADARKWFSVAAMYSKNLYDNESHDVFATPASESDYKRLILTRMIQIYLNDPRATVEGGLALFNQYKADPNFLLSRRGQSADLFRAHFKDRFVEGAPAEPLYPIAPLVAPKPWPSGVPSPIPSVLPTPVPSASPAPDPHADALGFITLVYPIAIDKEGPFKLPSPGIRKFPLSSSIEGRWFSNRWLGEFGGFPFLQITPDGVANHGPITMGEGDTWYLRRDNVSHSCMRMDASDLMELRALIPRNMNQLQKLGQTIPYWIFEWPDVADLDNNGTREVVDVAYYSLPTSGSAIGTVASWDPSVYNKTYWKRMFSPYAKKLKSKNTFTIATAQETDPSTGAAKTVNVGTFTGLPKYDVVNGTLKSVGYYTEPLPIKTFPQRPTQIIQYREDGTVYMGADDDGADRWGSYPPQVVNKFGRRTPTEK